ncbi:MAG TPA: RNA polymerase sigma factor region1.1 domain-containing protein, partial [Myxococcota bacterium]|nr:RNA polymerase sigma factor region1.1 domain-containing protein [Myxococcota bacterium]
MPSNASKSPQVRKASSKSPSCNPEVVAAEAPVASTAAAGDTNGFDLRGSAKSNGGTQRTPLRALESVRKLLDEGRRRGFLTLDDINRGLPDDVLSSEQLDDVLALFALE